MTDAKIDIEAPVAQATLPAPSLNSDEDDSNSTTLEYKDYPDQLPSYSLDAADKSPGLFLWLKTIFHWRSNALIPILAMVIWSSLAVLISVVLKNRVKQVGCKYFCTPLAVSPVTLSYVGFALFLLLGFRVNESHQRYIDGLQTWATIEGTVVTLSKYILQAFPRGFFHEDDHERILGWLVAFPVVLKRELRDERDLRELKHVLATDDLIQLQNSPNMAYHCMYVLSAYIMKAQNAGKYPAVFLSTLIRWIKVLHDSADVCTRIRKSPAAFSYVAHLRTFLILWLFLLPFSLVESASWGTPLITGAITYGVVGVELNAVELENPFGRDFNDIPLGNLCDRIQRGVRETYRASKAGPISCVHPVVPVQPPEGVLFWLDDSI